MNPISRTVLLVVSIFLAISFMSGATLREPPTTRPRWFLFF
ncbi:MULTISPECIES: hypothetical protein [Bacillaceae]|nr:MULTISPECIES: hypothetical protein [Bacillaceae]